MFAVRLSLLLNDFERQSVLSPNANIKHANTENWNTLTYGHTHTHTKCNEQRKYSICIIIHKSCLTDVNWCGLFFSLDFHPLDMIRYYCFSENIVLFMHSNDAIDWNWDFNFSMNAKYSFNIKKNSALSICFWIESYKKMRSISVSSFVLTGSTLYVFGLKQANARIRRPFCWIFQFYFLSYYHLVYSLTPHKFPVQIHHLYKYT